MTMATRRGKWREITPDEPPGSYRHVTDGTPCWCKPVIDGQCDRASAVGRVRR